MATKNDIKEFHELIAHTQEEIDEFLVERLGDIEIFLDERGLNEYNIIYETFDKIELSKSEILDRLKRLKNLLTRILKSQ